MKRTLVTLIALCSLSLGLAAMAPVPALAATPDKNQVCQGLGGTTKGDDCTTGGAKIQDIVNSVINILSIFIGLAAVIMIMVGGFKYVTANGDSGNVSSAKNTIIYAVIGLVIAVFAQVLVKFVLDKTK